MSCCVPSKSNCGPPGLAVGSGDSVGQETSLVWSHSGFTGLSLGVPGPARGGAGSCQPDRRLNGVVQRS